MLEDQKRWIAKRRLYEEPVPYFPESDFDMATIDFWYSIGSTYSYLTVMRLPELAQVPDAFLQEPWLWPGAGRLLGRAYPAPVVDVAQAGRAARDRVWAVRCGDAFQAEAERLVQRHSVRKRAPRRRAPRGGSGRQLCLDLWN